MGGDSKVKAGGSFVGTAIARPHGVFVFSCSVECVNEFQSCLTSHTQVKMMDEDKESPGSLWAAIEYAGEWWHHLIDTLSGPPPNKSVLAERWRKPFWLRYPISLVGMSISLMLLIAPEFVN